MDISRPDLGLLLSLDVLLAERNVSRAAARLGISQSALSTQLGRLRVIFGDKLLVPSGRRMLPTARAESLQAPLHDLLERLRGLVSEERHFDPATSDRTFRVAASDFVHLVLSLLTEAARIAPSVRLALLPFDAQRAWAQLEADEVDLIIGSERLTPKDAAARRLFDETLVFIQRRGHPRGRRKLTLDAFCALDHILVSPDGGGFSGATDLALAELGRTRRVVASLPSFLLAPPLVAGTDMVALVPKRLAQHFQRDCESFDPPFAVSGFVVFASWHQRRQRDPAHQWLRAFVSTAATGRPAPR